MNMAELVHELPAESADDEHEAHGLGTLDAVRIAVIAVAAACEWLGLWEPFGRVSPIAIAALAIGGWPIFAEAFENLIERRMTMELSMTIAIVAAAAISEFFTALVITLFVLVAEVLEGMTVSRGRRAIRDMLDVLPHAVAVRRAGAVREVAACEIAVGEAILIAPGGLVPADGTVLAGHSFVDESRITGEALPVEKLAGAKVFAGSINQSGALEIRADRLGRDTSYGKIIEAVERAERSRAPVQRLADRLAGYLVYFALAAAALTLFITHDIRATIAVVIVAGACGIAAGTPLAILGAIGRAARAGAIIKGGLYLETLGRIDTVVLDKTGTLTYGRPEMRSILPEAGVTQDEVLDAASSAELRSEHPLGKAIVAYARAAGRPLVEPDRFAYTPGRGIEATVAGRTILVGNRVLLDERSIAAGAVVGDNGGARVLVARDGKAMGTIVVADRLRPEARNAVARLRRMGLRTILLTGDTREAVDSVAAGLDLDEIGAELLPEHKLARIRTLVAGGACVAMVGDGVNDAPALAAADVGVAMGSGTDVARECADIVLLGNDLARFVEVVALARRTRVTIWQNFAGTILVDLVGIALASVGLLGPLLATFVHVASEMTFILNSARLLPPPRRRPEGQLQNHPSEG
jgi:Cd2+/Zn2+-exporting ATPase/Cu+-exporting ATPase